MPPVRLDPFKNIVGVGWLSAPDVCFLVDDSGSMDTQIIVMVRDWAQRVLDEYRGARVGYSNFRDFPVAPYGSPGDFVYARRIPLNTAANTLLFQWLYIADGGGGDTEEAHYDALIGCVRDQAMGWRRPKKIIVIVSDAPPHNYPITDPAKPHATILEAILELRARETAVVWVDTRLRTGAFLGGFTVNVPLDSFTMYNFANRNAVWESVKAGIDAALAIEDF